MLPLTPAEMLRFRARVAAQDAVTGCREWTGNVSRTTGYGRFKLRGKYVEAYRLACSLAHGEPPFEGAQAAHGCTNKLCVAPAHLKWKTPAQNQRDRRRDGTDNYTGPHLDKATVREIAKAGAEGFRTSDIAAHYGVHVTTVRSILSGRSWSRVTRIGR